ncbi:MAG TPA: metallophosphoesterase family protein [Algoriphagus sp.]|nr:metallophosphoesterase family protein [Algoriphagus sp.]
MNIPLSLPRVSGFLLVPLALTFCNPKISTQPTLKEVADEVVTRLYKEIPADSLNLLDEKFLMDYMSEAEKEILAKGYWVFEVNQPVRISLMRDKSQKSVPFWLEPSGFEKTPLLVKNEMSEYEVWQKVFEKGKVELGINGLDKHRPVYFVSIAPVHTGTTLEIKPIFPAKQHQEKFQAGAFTYHDWDGLKLTEVPESLQGEILLTTVRGRAREAHFLNAFRKTIFPSSESADQVLLTWTGDPSNSVSIQWRTADLVKESKIQYWEKSSQDTLETISNTYRMEDRLLQNDRYIQRHTTRLRDLKPGTRYEYRIVSNSKSGDILEFQTAESNPVDFSFLWFGDMHNDEKTGKMLQDATSRNPETRFYVQSGDLVNTGLYRDNWDELFGYTGKAWAQRPFMPVPGNHDSQDGLGAWMYQELFDLPTNGPDSAHNEFTYFFKYHDPLFLMMDGTLPIEGQTEWIEKTLAENPAKWKFMVVHFPMFNSVEPYPDIQREWLPALEKHGVDLVMSGHFHFYMRSKPLAEFTKSSSRMMFVHSAATSGGFESETQNWDQIDATFPDDYLYQKIDLKGNTLTLTSYKTDGEVLDKFEIRKD